MRVKSLKSLLLLALVAMVFVSCQHRQFGHLSKVRVKPNKQEQKKSAGIAKPESSTDISEEIEPIVEASVANSKAYVEPRKETYQKPPVISKKANPKQERLKNQRKKNRDSEEPNPEQAKLPNNVPAILSFGMGVLSAISFLMLFASLDFSFFFWSSMITAILSVILGILGMVNYNKGKTRNGLWISIAGIILGSFIVLTLLLLIFFILLFNGLSLV